MPLDESSKKFPPKPRWFSMDVKLFICSFCGKCFKDEELLKIHQTEIGCSVINQSITRTLSKKEKNHSQSHHEKFKLSKDHKQPSDPSVDKQPSSQTFLHNGQSFKCPNCSRSFPDEISLEDHLESHKLPISCSFCDEKIYQPNFLIGHYFAIHPKEAKGKIRCASCDLFFYITELQRHHELHIVDCRRRDYKCDICNTICGDLSSLTLHQSMHKQVNRFQCSHCPRSFVNLSTKKNHEKIHDDTKPLFGCPKCQFHSISKSAVKNHIIKVHNILQYECYFCDLNFTNWTEMLKHEKSHEKSFHCHECHKSFSSKNDLNIHVSQHPLEDGPWACQFCQKEFRERIIRDGHQWTHFM